MELNEVVDYLYWPIVGLGLFALNALAESLKNLAKRKLKRGTLMRRIVLLDEANDPDEIIPRR
jgi:hypothetical protein